MYPKSEIQGLKAETRNFKAGVIHPQPSTFNPVPSTLNPQPSTLNPQPSTLNLMQDFAAHLILAVFTIPMYWCYWKSWKADPGVIPPQPQELVRGIADRSSIYMYIYK